MSRLMHSGSASAGAMLVMLPSRSNTIGAAALVSTTMPSRPGGAQNLPRPGSATRTVVVLPGATHASSTVTSLLVSCAGMSITCLTWQIGALVRLTSCPTLPGRLADLR
ncbi:MAG TPA: hypothetical protein VLX92_03690 [Kofleriaceae bacterium]|nr:hypothetical protein [Kofleriaceae bacterium]